MNYRKKIEKNPVDKLRELKPMHEFFIGIDSDGSAFDTMEIKQKECFCPNLIKYFELQTVSRYTRETWEFVNLYSIHRGYNRFIALVKFFEMLSERKDVIARKQKIPDTSALKEWINKESKLANPVLEEYVNKVNDPVLGLALQWSKKVNSDIAEMVYGMPPFPFVRESLDKIVTKADIIIVSQTPVEALTREWKENNIDKYPRAIAGQEYGTKAEHIKFAAKGKYPDNKILMVGDAPRDLEAARSNGVLFYPVNPGHEIASWERLYRESLEKFFEGSYEGDYEKKLIREFEAYLPAEPPWEQI
ncbi:MAG: HAD family hydrolase [Bacteroidales bacterium]|nr:MAG: HAD family hydrolase [Bacteroidales bacterium]